MSGVMVHVFERGVATRQFALTGATSFGREACDVVLDDPKISRSHVRLTPTAEGVLVEDVGSSNGTFVDGARVSSVVLAHTSDVVVGDCVLRLVVPESLGAGAAEPQAPAVAAAPVATSDGDSLSVDADGIVVRFSRETPRTVARSVLDLAKRARKRLRGFGSEPGPAPVTIRLIGPYPNPDGSGAYVTSGTVVDADHRTLWIVTSPETPPDDPHRGLARLFGAELPVANGHAYLLDGLGLHLAGIDDPPSEVLAMVSGPLGELPADIQVPAAVSFVRYLADQTDDDTVKTFLAASAFDQAAKELFGRPVGELQQRWLHEASALDVDVKPGEFLRLAVRYLRPYWLRQAEVFLYVLLSLAFTSAYPFVTQRLFDTAIPSGEFGQVMTLLVILGGAFLISLVAGLRQAVQSAWIAGAIVRDLRAGLFAKVQRLPAATLARMPQGDVLSRMFSDVSQVQAGLTETITGGISQMVGLVVSTVIMMTVDWRLGLIVLAAAPLVSFVYRRMADGAQSRSIEVQESNSDLLGVAAENHRANPVVKMFRLRSREQRRFDRAAEEMFTAFRRLQLFAGLFGLSVNMIVTVLRLVILGLGTWLIFEGEFTVGGLVAFLGVMGEVLSPITGLTSLGQSIQSAMGALTRVNELLDADTEPDGEALPDLAPIRQGIRLDGASFSYTAQKRAVDDLDVVIRAGTRVAFVGPSGSGKSTILKLLMRLYELDEGVMSIDGVDVRQRSLDSLRAQMGVVFQDSFLFDTTVRENIALGKPDATEEEILAAARAAEVDAFIGALPNGYNTVVGEGGSNLSGGQRQRVSIARALVANPPILLFDEATSALDPATEAQINETLKNVSHGRTVVAITHRLTSITDYDTIYVVVDGSLAEQGSHDELVALGGVYARLWAEQTGAPMPEARAPFDVVRALASMPVFRHLDERGLAELAGQATAASLAPGAIVPETPDRLVVVSQGRGEIITTRVGGVDITDVGPGGAFGLNALLGDDQDRHLRATEQISLLIFGRDVLHRFARSPGAGEVRAESSDGSTVIMSGDRLADARATTRWRVDRPATQRLEGNQTAMIDLANLDRLN